MRPTPEPAPVDVQAALTFLVQGKSKVGAERIALLQAIERSGSLSSAAKDVGLSYKGAWDALKTMNNMLPRPVAITQAGGKHGGETIITAHGHRMITAFHQMQSELARFTAHLCQDVAQTTGVSSALLEGFFMRTSARNMLRGTVRSITPGAVNTEIVLKISDQAELVAIVTEPSVVELGLHVGGDAIALIKSSFVILALDEPGLRLSTRNRIKGVVAHVEDGAVNAEVAVDISHGKTLTAIITRQSVQDLNIVPGVNVVCCIKASHIILAVE